MTLAEIFDRAGRALFGDQYIAPLAHMLSVGKETVRKWAAGKSTVPAGVWEQLGEALLERGREVAALLPLLPDLTWADVDPAPSASAPRLPTVKSRNAKDGLIILSRPVTQEDSIALKHSLDAFTERHGLPKSVVGSGVSAMIIAKLPPMTGDLQAAFEQWFNAECDRIDREG